MAETCIVFKPLTTVSHLPCKLRVIIDNQSVQQGAALNATKECKPTKGNSIGLWAIIGPLLQQCCEVSCMWVPSHGKRPDWCPPEGFDSTDWRTLNDATDKEASRIQEVPWEEESPMRQAREAGHRRGNQALIHLHRGAADFARCYPDEEIGRARYSRRRGIQQA